MRPLTLPRATSRLPITTTAPSKHLLRLSVRPTRLTPRSPTPFPNSTPSIHKFRQRSFASHARCYSCACQSAARRTKTAYIALGSNLGDRVAEIEKACRLMDERGIRVKRTSSLYETEPMYVVDQERFLNGACEVGLYPFFRGKGPLLMVTLG